MSQIDFAATAGTTYYFAVDGEDGAVGTASLTLTDLGGGGGGVELPAGALGVIDFTNGGALWGATEYDLVDVIDQPGLRVPDIGLWIQEYELVDPFDSLPVVALLAGSFLDFLLANDFTFTIEFYTDGFSQPIWANGSTFGDISLEYVFDGYVLGHDHNEVHEVEIDEVNALDVPAHNIVAYTQTPDKIALQLAYGPLSGVPYEDTTGGTVTMAATAVQFGGRTATVVGSMLITRIVFYPTMANDDLGDVLTDALLQPPANDDFADAIALTVDVIVTGHNFLATVEASEPDHGGISSLSSVWYSFVAPSTGTFNVVISSIGDFGGDGPVVSVYTGASVGALVEIATGTDWPGVTVPFAATNGVTYHIAVDGARGGDPGSSPFQIEVTT